MTQYVYDFTEGNKDQKDLLGGKGANLAEMTRLGLPVPPGFTITTEACREYLALGTEPGELRVQVTMALRHLEDGVGRRLGDRHDPLLVSVRSGREVLDARHDGNGAQHRPERRERQGSGGGVAATSGSPGTPTAGCCRCTARPFSTCPARCSPMRWTRRRPTQGVISDVDLEVDGLKGLVDAVQERDPGAFRAGVPAASAGATGHWRSRAVFNSWNTDRARLYRRRERIPQDLGTAVNICTMVFGNLGRDQWHRRRFHPRPGHRQDRCVRRLPGQRAGRGRRRRHPQHAEPGRPGELDPTSHQN